MSTTVILNGLSYSIPAEGDANWGLNVSNYLIAIASACLQKTGGTYTLTAEVDFGATYGLKLSYVKSRATNPSSAGIFRLGNNESVGWRNAANTSDLLLKVNSSDNLEYNGTKVTLSGAIVDADISASAAITLSKLAALTASRVLVSDGSGVISASSVTSTTLGYLDATSSIQTQLNGKEPTITSLALNRLAAVTASRALASDASGFITASSVTDTELGYLSGVSSSVQTQLNGKEPTISVLPISKGGTNSGVALANGKVMVSTGGAIVESSTTTTQLSYLDATSSVQTQLNGKANVYLSNLDANTTVNSTLKPQSAFTQNLGTSGYPWGDIYGANIYGTSDIRSPLIKVRENVLSSTKYVNINGPASMTASYDVTLPSSQGASNSVLTNDGSGNLTWVAPTGSIGTATGQSLVLAASSPTLNASAILQADSTTKGFLPPRMTQAQRDAISTPATGLEVYNTDTNKLNIYNGTSWGEVGSGSSGINYIADTDGTVQGAWVTYADAAGSSPVDGTGGSANVTFATSSNSDLRGTTNFLFTHDAVNRQGQGFSYNFTIDKADQAKMLQIRFDYLVASGTYADGDLTVWVYDVTNATLIQPAPYKILNAVGAQPFLAEFQTASNSTSYRLIFHVTTTTATAYTMRFDNFSVGPQINRAYGTPVTDWVSYTTTLSNAGNATATTLWSRDGGDILIRGTITLGSTSPTGVVFFTLPPGLSIDTNRMTTGITSANSFQNVGSAQYRRQSDGASFELDVHRNSTSLNQFYFFSTSSPNGDVTGTVPVTAAATNTITINEFRVPIAGWSSNTVMSSDITYSDDVGSVHAFAVPSASPPAGYLYADGSAVSRIQYSELFAKIGTTFGSGDGSTTFNLPDLRGIFVRGAGFQTISGNTYSGTLATKQTDQMQGHIHSSVDSFTSTTGTKPYAWTVASAGNYAIRNDSLGAIGNPYTDGTNGTPRTGTQTHPANIALTYFIKYVKGSTAQIAASETVAARYHFVAGGTPIPNSDAKVLTNTYVTYTKTYDTTNSFNTTTGVYTVPVSGKYKVTASLGFASQAMSNTAILDLNLRKNGSAVSCVGFKEIQSNNTMMFLVNGSDEVNCLAGDTLDLTIFQNNGGTRTLNSDSRYGFVIFERIGNY